MQQYLKFLEHILEFGTEKQDRTGTGTCSVFGYQMRFNLQDGFPIVTTKKIHFKSVVYELLWFLKGDTNVQYLQDHGVRIWNEWADENGELGPIYGKQWRSWTASDGRHIDQISDVMTRIRKTPNSRRLIVSAWNAGEIDAMALPPCHAFFQFYVHEGKLSCMLTQRSADAFLGVPFNIASYALLTFMIAKQCDLDVGDFVWSGGDCHIYTNHMDQVLTQKSLEPKQLPVLQLNPNCQSLFDYSAADIELLDYAHHPALKAKVSV